MANPSTSSPSISALPSKAFHLLQDQGVRATVDKGLSFGLRQLQDLGVSLRVAADAAQATAALRAAGSGARGLFIDCGSNLGQGLSYFRRFYRPSHFDYVLIEPNPNCVSKLREQLGPGMELITAAASTCDGETTFYGLNEGEADPFSQGASILPEHNSARYQSSEDKGIRVPTFSLAQLITKKRAHYPILVLKLDIEGGEYNVLDDLLRTNACDALRCMYVEFHSQYMSEPDRTTYHEREQHLTAAFKRRTVGFRTWY